VEWVVSLDAQIPETFSDELAEQLVEDLKEYSPAVGGRGQRVGVTMSVEARTDRRAFDRAHAAFRQALGHSARVIDARVQSVDELERELEAPAVPALAGIREVAQILGVTRQRASELAGSAGFPKPIAELAAGPVWFHSAIRSFNEQWERRPGRPRARKTEELQKQTERH
jgi:hypothetical protein